QFCPVCGPKVPPPLLPRAELGSSSTMPQTFLSAKKSSPVNCILLKKPFVSKKKGSLRQPANKRQSLAFVTTASCPAETGAPSTITSRSSHAPVAGVPCIRRSAAVCFPSSQDRNRTL